MMETGREGWRQVGRGKQIDKRNISFFSHGSGIIVLSVEVFVPQSFRVFRWRFLALCVLLLFLILSFKVRNFNF